MVYCHMTIPEDTDQCPDCTVRYNAPNPHCPNHPKPMTTIQEAAASAAPKVVPSIIKPPANPFTVVIATQQEKIQQAQNCFGAWNNALQDAVPPGQQIAMLPMVGAKSMASAYNQAIGALNTEFVIFSHNDAFPVMLPTYRCGKRLQERMKDLDVAYFCGSSHFCGGRWQDASPYLYGAVLNLPPNPAPNVAATAITWQRPARVIKGIRVGDGYCIAMRTEAARKLGFDSSLKSWHFYDLDLGLTADAAGLRVGVISDVYILHQSSVGYQAPEWAAGVDQFLKKWRGKADPTPVGVGVTPGSVTGVDGRMILSVLQEQEKFMQDEIDLRKI